MLTTDTIAVKHANFTLSVYNACVIAIAPLVWLPYVL